MLACNLSVLQKISVLDIAILTSTFWILYSNTQQYASPMGAVCPSQKWLTQGFDTYWVSVIDHAVKNLSIIWIVLFGKTLLESCLFQNGKFS